MPKQKGVFRNERALQRTIAQYNFDLGNKFCSTYSSREVRVGGCIPDLVYVHFSSTPDKTPWPRCWAFRHAYIIWLLRKWTTLSLERIAQFCFASANGRIGDTVNDLVVSGALEKIESGELRLSPSVKSISADVIAIEAKLWRWQRAITQAVSYKAFADYAIVAMDALQAPEDPAILERFKTNEIGLCAVSYDSISWLVQPERSEEPVSPDKEHLIFSALSGRFQTSWS